MFRHFISVVGFAVGILGLTSPSSWASEGGPDGSVVAVDSSDVAGVGGQGLRTLGGIHRVFEDPFVPLGGADVEDDRAFGSAVQSYVSQSDPTDLKVFEQFLVEHIDSRWRVSLETELGLAYYRYGYFSRAMAILEDAWHQGKDSADAKIKPVVDQAIGEAIRMHARLGHDVKIAELLDEVKDRTLTGPATEAVAGAKQGLWLMQNEPGFAYLCGPSALKNYVFFEQKGRVPQMTSATLDVATRTSIDRIASYKSGTKGVSLLELEQLAADAGADVVAVKRPAGEEMPLPAVVHWKVNHYAALIEKRGNRYHMIDPTFGADLWISQDALESESSGYVMISRADEERLQWQHASDDEARGVYGRGNTTSSDPFRTAVNDCHCRDDKPKEPGMAAVSAHSMLVSLHIVDTPLSYVPAYGPAVDFTVIYNQREATQPAVFNYFNLSPKWNFNWLSYIQDDPTMPGASVTAYLAGGGGESYSGYNPNDGSFTVTRRDGSQLFMKGAGGYEVHYNDGSKYVYGQPDGSTIFPRRIFLTKVVDPQGNAVTLTYDGQMRLTQVTDAPGNVSTLQYGLSAYPLLVTEIDDPFGRSAKLGYDSTGRLVSSTDSMNMTSTYVYQTGAGNTFVSQLVTGYGTSNFSYGEAGINRWLQMTDPLGQTQRLEFTQGVNGIPFNESVVPQGIMPFNEYMNYRNTFYWDEHAFAVGNGDYTKAHITHWLHNVDNTSMTDGAIESIKDPLENRVWYNYPGQANVIANGTLEVPSAVGRVLDDGTTDLRTYTYTKTAKVLTASDAIGRTKTYAYDPANGVDLLSVKQTNGGGSYDLLGSYTYNGMHEPLTYTDAAGNVTHYAYNNVGQLTGVTDPLGHQTAYNYGSDHHLQSITDANSVVVKSFTYDAVGRVHTMTDSTGLTVTYAYDNLDRLVQASYPDGTSRQIGYTLLDPTSVTDRTGLTTNSQYSARRELLSVTDPQGNSTSYGHDEAMRVTSVLDPNGNQTQWTRDIQGRVTAKTDAAGKTTNTVYFPASGRLESVTDALGQQKAYTYTKDGQIAGIQYINSVVPTPNVTYVWDAGYVRLSSMADGTGTTQYQYVNLPPGPLGVSLLYQERVPFNNAVANYAYDALGRVQTRSIDQAGESFGYDAIGRLVQHVSPLGHETIGYLNETAAVTSRSWAEHPFGTQIGYLALPNDPRLQTIQYTGQTPETMTLSTTAESRITQIADQTVAGTLTRSFGYDNAERLTTESDSDGTFQTTTPDAAGNITAQSGTLRNATFTFNALNQATSRSVPSGTTGYGAGALDPNVLSRRYDYDAEHRIVKISYIDGSGALTGATTTIGYDGLSRWTTMTEQGAPVNGVMPTPVTTHYRWCGDTLCQARDGNDNVLATYYDEGVAQGSGGAGLSLFYQKNQVGTVQAVIDGNGALISSTRYDAWGNPNSAPVGAAGVLPLGFAGLYYHQQSGLHFAEHRMYDPSSMRWLNRDPIEEQGGLNLYAYVLGNSVRLSDPTGRFASPWHAAISFIAARESGLGIGDSLALAWYSVATDIGTQSIADSNIHSMTMPGQSVEDAIAGRNQYEQDQLDQDTLQSLGNAMHSAEDEFAKGHRFKVWNGHLEDGHEFYDWFPFKGDVDSAICAAKYIIAHRRRVIAGP